MGERDRRDVLEADRVHYVVGTLSRLLGVTTGIEHTCRSPEQAMGENLDARADLYALGLVLYELIAGEPAFPGSGQTKLFARVRAAERTALAALAPAETPPALVDIVESPAGRHPHGRAAPRTSTGTTT